MAGFESIVASLSAAFWGVPMIAALFGTHVFLTFRLGGVQKHIFRAIRLSLTREKGSTGDVSPFSALMTALAATLGTGNIVGVATAVAAGGPGAVLWMWISGVFGMATKYAESLLSVKYRVRQKDGSMAGGPMYVMERGLHLRGLGKAFALFTALAAPGVGAMVQANSISSMLHRSFAVPCWSTGLVLAVLCGCVILGGIRSIAKVCNLIIPAMGLLFVGSNLVILALGAKTIPDTIGLIFSSAFTGQAAIGGFAGAGLREACRFGVSRGLFSNEAGLGSEPIVAAAAQTKSPVRQALVSMTGTFWDTVVLAALTGIMVVNSGLWKTGAGGAALTGAVFATLPVAGPVILSCSLFAFAFATSIGWSYYAEKAVEYLFGGRAVRPYKLFYLVMLFVGSVFSVELVWNLSDIANALMAIPNLACVLVLSDVVAAETRKKGFGGA